MNACHAVRNWITQNVLAPVSRFFERAEEVCEEIREWVEREVRRRVETTRTRTERRCKRRKCKKICLCCNKWFCWIATVVLRIVEYVVEVVGEWVVETVCKVVTKLVEIVVELVLAIVRFAVVVTVCLVTDPRGALDAVIDLWFDLLDVVEDVRDLVDDGLAAVSDLLDITREFVLDIGGLLGPVGRILGGLIAGALDIGRRFVDGTRRVVRGVFDTALGVGRLDFCGAVEGMLNGVAFGFLQQGFAFTNVLSLGGGGVRDAFDRERLRSWLHAEIGKRYDEESVEALVELLRLETTSFGVRWPVHPMRCVIPSRSPHLDLAQLHRDGQLNLYAIAGYAPIACDEWPGKRDVWKLVYADTEMRVSVSDIRAYLRDGPHAAPEFELISGDKRAFRDTVRVAEMKFRQMAIDLDIARMRRFELISVAEWIIPDPNIATVSDSLQGASPLARRVTDTLGLSDYCDLPAISVFRYDPQHFGLASAAWSDEEPYSPPMATAATIRSSLMEHLFGTILAHEMGHCFDLRHDGHDGMEHIMFTADDADLVWVTDNTVGEYLLITGEPRFTYEDAQNAWRWILAVAGPCIGSPTRTIRTPVDTEGRRERNG